MRVSFFVVCRSCLSRSVMYLLSWVMSAIDEVGFRKNPPVGVLPLGTGNDLSRSLDWGPGYSDTSLSKILSQMENATVEQMDRWFIDSSDHNVAAAATTATTTVPGATMANSTNSNDNDQQQQQQQQQLPLNVMNNYFSIGVDATACLKFHSERGGL